MAFFKVKDVYKNFGSNKVLKGIDFELDEGQVLAIIGSSGSGKTTLLRCINFLEIPDKADIYLNGENIFSIDELAKADTKADEAVQESNAANTSTSINDEDAAIHMPLDNSKEAGVDIVAPVKDKKEKVKQNKISKEKKKQIAEQRLKFGMVFQSFNLFPHYSVQKNLTLAAKLKYDKSIKSIDKYFSKTVRLSRKQAFKEIDERAVALLQRVGLGEKLKAYPCELSGGQQQRVAIARALILQPEILCFDEPTSALDPELTREVLRVINDLRECGRTMIVVTHDTEFARNAADKVAFMSDGKVSAYGAPYEIFEACSDPNVRAFLS